MVIFILSSIGMTTLLCYAKIFDPIRPNGYFWRCPMCMGFHVGWFLYLVFIISGSPLMSGGIITHFIGMFMYGCISSVCSYITNMLIDDNGINISINDKKQ